MSSIANNQIMSGTVNTTSSNLDEQKHQKYRRATVLVAVVLLATTLAAGYTTQQVVSSRMEGFFERQADQVANTYYQKLHSNLTILEGIRGYWNVSTNFTEDKFTRYLDSYNIIPLDKTGASSYFYAPAVKKEDKDEFLQKIKNEPNVNSAYQTATIHPESDTPIHYPAIYAVPLKGREGSIGLDFATYPSRLSAIEYARDNNVLATTMPDILLTTGNPGFFLILPLFDQDVSIASTEERRDAFKGVVGATFRTESAFEQIFGGENPYPYLDFQIYHGEATTPDRLLHDHDPWEAKNPPRFEVKRIVRIADQTWTIVVQSKPSLTLGDKEERLPMLVFLAGLIATILAIALSIKNYIAHLKTHQS